MEIMVPYRFEYGRDWLYYYPISRYQAGLVPSSEYQGPYTPNWAYPSSSQSGYSDYSYSEYGRVRNPAPYEARSPDSWLVAMYAPSIEKQAQQVVDTGVALAQGQVFNSARLALSYNPLFGSLLADTIFPEDKRTQKELDALAKQQYEGWNYAPLPLEYPNTQSEIWYRTPDYGHVEDSSASSFGRKLAFLKRK